MIKILYTIKEPGIGSLCLHETQNISFKTIHIYISLEKEDDGALQITYILHNCILISYDAQ